MNNFLMEEYELLAHYLKGMIQDGCQIVHGGNLIDWSDTAIPEALSTIDNLRKDTGKIPNLNLGDELRHKSSGQNMIIVEINEGIVSVNPGEIPIKYQIHHILEEFEIIKK